MEMKRAEFVIHGRVQGVGFRCFVQTHAVSLKLRGYTRNLWDGTVLVVAEGNEHQLKILRGYLESGPSMSRVTKLDVTFSEFTGEFDNFEIR
jgi:acylphosphatase